MLYSFTKNNRQARDRCDSGIRAVALLGRSLTIDEAREVTNIARRIAAILLLETELDATYQAVKQVLYAWRR